MSVDEAARSALTGPDGRFAIAGLTPGTHRLYVSVVGYALYRSEVTIGPEQPAPLTIRLNEGTTAYNENVTVTPDVFRSPPEPVPSASVLGSADLQNLRGVLADDPLRAVQVLPGVATGDDFRSEFTVRGSDFSHLTITLDGFATPYLLHTVRGVEDRGPTGSVAMINSDVLEDVTLLNGGYPQRYEGHTGAEMDFRLRDGSRDRRLVRIAVSGTNASGVAEGPIGSRHRGSWFMTARQSYLDLIIHHITNRGVSFGFADAQAKVSYDLTPNQRVDATVLAGHSRFDNDPTQTAIDAVSVGLDASVVGLAGWHLTRPKLLLSQRILVAGNHFRNGSPQGAQLDNGRDRQLAYRTDATFTASRTLVLDAGGEAERRDDARIRVRLPPGSKQLVRLDDYTGNALDTGTYAMAKWTAISSLTIAPGVRAEHTTLTHQTTGSPWLETEWRARAGTKIRASAGRYQQFADFHNVLGVSGGENLAPERAGQFDVGVEQRLRGSFRLTATLYDREEAGMLRLPGSETSLVDGRVVRGSPITKYENRLDGYARGIELLVQRSVPGRGVSGWIAYAYGSNRDRDRVTGETFCGDADQRHTLNGYALYRRSERASFVVKFRYGSNFPITGYFAQQNGQYVVTDVRNTARLPDYARLDLRANRTYNWSRRRLTLFAEVINVLNRENVRFTPPSVNTATRTVSKPFDSTLPIVPSAGILIEF